MKGPINFSYWEWFITRRHLSDGDGVEQDFICPVKMISLLLSFIFGTTDRFITRQRFIEQDIICWPMPLHTCIHSCPIYTVRLSKYTWIANTTQFKVQAVCLVLNVHHSFDQRKILFLMPLICIPLINKMAIWYIACVTACIRGRGESNLFE